MHYSLTRMQVSESGLLPNFSGFGKNFEVNHSSFSKYLVNI